LIKYLAHKVTLKSTCVSQFLKKSSNGERL